MAFFGLTYLGYQRPVGDKMLSSAQIKLNVQDVSVLQREENGLPPINTKRGLTCADPCGGLIPDQYFKQIIRHVHKSPKEVYRVPLTDNQQYGWWVPTGGPKNQEPWTRIRRFPRRNSEMTKFVNEMATTNSDFSLF
ncbi:testis-expressed protein 49-like [Triplophysa rosa]|uniref:Testis-expressed protein 49 n=1 Tax=Triplophysa rosa TaxID=992332 RepID=A0A9W7TC66_TRIRA|nr:testis-expressed protein 49-like [Triplophysa rosa]KAI7794607.1 hypothetical protein IRJ41_016802 [Triplophysa rosa]